MEILLEKLGIDYRLLLAQAVNFLIVLAVLRFALYKPLLSLLRERRGKIEAGLQKADEADRRLGEITQMQKDKLKEAEAQAQQLMAQTRQEAKKQEELMMREVAKKETVLMEQANAKAKAQEAEAMKKVREEAVQLVKQVLIKTVELSPEAVDEKLIRTAAVQAKQNP